MGNSSKFKIILIAGLINIFLLNIPVYAQLPRAIKWVTKSVEYAAVCVQTYRSAWQAVKARARHETRPWVVIMDVDETVLDNSQYALERVAVDSGYTPQSWAKWVQRMEAGLIPGAKAFIDSVHALGTRGSIAYITDRDYALEKPTIENLKKYGLFEKGDIILTRKGPNDTKAKRRHCVETGSGPCKDLGPRVIIALIGDNIRDIVPVYSMEKARKLRNEIIPNDPKWGTKYFVLPNPTYGSWERDYR